MNGIFYVLRAGCQWKAVPNYYGSGSTVHRYFQEWTQRDVFGELWKRMLRRYDARRGIAWRWQSLNPRASNMITRTRACFLAGPR